MAKKKAQKKRGWIGRQWLRLRYWLRRSVIWLMSLVILAVLLFSVVNPPFTFTMLSEKRALGRIDRQWVPMKEIAPVMRRSAVAAEDANFCLHWGFDMEAIRLAIAQGAARGGSTISQQTVKNAFLWQGRSWLRKAMEAAMTPVIGVIERT